jgi:DHA2 family multidrug resistance protein
VIAGLAGYLFLVQMFTAEKPFIEPGLFKYRNFTAGVLLIFSMGVMMFSTMALLPPFLQNLLGFPVITTGLLLAPRGIGTMLAMFVVGRLVGKIDTRALVLFGLSLMAYSMWEMAKFTDQIGLYEIIYTGVVQGVGMGFVFVPLSAAAFTTLPQRYRNEGTAMFSLARNIGSSIGISIVVTILGRETQISHAALAENITRFNHALHGPGIPSIWNLSTNLGLAAMNATVTKQAATIAYINDFRLMMYLTLLAAPLLLLIKPPAKRAAAA